MIIFKRFGFDMGGEGGGLQNDIVLGLGLQSIIPCYKIDYGL